MLESSPLTRNLANEYIIYANLMLDGELSPSRIPKTQLICSYSATASARRGDCFTDDVYSTKGASK
jgi:hypothetical protein